MNGLFSPMLRRIRINAVIGEISGDVLDFGCNDGSFSRDISCTSYTGVDVDENFLATARQEYPQHRFVALDTLQADTKRYDTIVSLAVIGLIDDQTGFLRQIERLLSPNGRIVLTTPHPALNWLHKLGSKIGLTGNDFGYAMRDALPDRRRFEYLASESGLRIVTYKRFLFGANQLVVLERQLR